MDLEKEFAEFKEKVKDEFKRFREAFDGLTVRINNLTAEIEDLKKAKEKNKDESWF